MSRLWLLVAFFMLAHRVACDATQTAMDESRTFVSEEEESWNPDLAHQEKVYSPAVSSGDFSSPSSPSSSSTALEPREGRENSNTEAGSFVYQSIARAGLISPLAQDQYVQSQGEPARAAVPQTTQARTPRVAAIEPDSKSRKAQYSIDEAVSTPAATATPAAIGRSKRPRVVADEEALVFTGNHNDELEGGYHDQAYPQQGYYGYHGKKWPWDAEECDVHRRYFPYAGPSTALVTFDGDPETTYAWVLVTDRPKGGSSAGELTIDLTLEQKMTQYGIVRPWPVSTVLLHEVQKNNPTSGVKNFGYVYSKTLNPSWETFKPISRYEYLVLRVRVPWQYPDLARTAYPSTPLSSYETLGYGYYVCLGARYPNKYFKKCTRKSKYHQCRKEYEYGHRYDVMDDCFRARFRVKPIRRQDPYSPISQPTCIYDASDGNTICDVDFDSEWQDIWIPFWKFSNDWGRCVGRLNTQCSTCSTRGNGLPAACEWVDKTVCPTSQDLNDLSQISIWAQGAPDTFGLAVKWIRAANWTERTFDDEGLSLAITHTPLGSRPANVNCDEGEASST